MHECMHACMHACVHACMHACMHAYIHTHMHNPPPFQISGRPDQIFVGVPDSPAMATYLAAQLFGRGNAYQLPKLFDIAWRLRHSFSLFSGTCGADDVFAQRLSQRLSQRLRSPFYFLPAPAAPIAHFAAPAAMMCNAVVFLD